MLAQIAAEELGLPVERVRVLLCDTDLTPDGGPTTASRQTYVSGNAARYAAATMREALASVAAERMSVPPEQIRFEDGMLRYNGSTVAIGEVVNWMHQQGLEAKVRYAYDAPQTQPLGTGGDMHFAFSYATQAALVEVDLETGTVKVLRIIAANDVGRAINPMTLHGQVEGGIMMGMGNCLTEEYIVENGDALERVVRALQDAEHQAHAGDHLASGRRADQPGTLRREGRGRDHVDQHDARHCQRHLSRDRRARLSHPGGSGCPAARDPLWPH